MGAPGDHAYDEFLFWWFIQSGLWERIRVQHKYISDVPSYTTQRL
jgi:hypothetical protein